MGNNETKKQSKHWIFTDYEVKTEYAWNENVNYAIWQTEECPTTKRHHNQGFVTFHRKLTLQSAKKYISNRANLQHANSITRCINYCSKNKTRIAGPWEFGNKPRFGKKKLSISDDSVVKGTPLTTETTEIDMKTINELIKMNYTHEDFIMKCTNLYKKYTREIKDLLKINHMKKLITTVSEPKKKKLLAFHGDPGTGKSTLLQEFYSSRNLQPYSYNGGIWFDGYNKQPAIFFDEVQTGSFSATLFNMIIDGRITLVQCKGGHVNLEIEELAMISNFEIKKWFRTTKNGPPIAYHAFKRRIDVEFSFSKEGEYNKLHIEVHDPRQNENPVIHSLQYRYLAKNTYAEIKKIAKILLLVLPEDSIYKPSNLVLPDVTVEEKETFELFSNSFRSEVLEEGDP